MNVKVKNRGAESSDRWIRHHVNCCACGRAMKTSQYINLIMLGKRATWKYPAAGNVVTGQPAIEAIAIICDVCLEDKMAIRWAVEFDQKKTLVSYHKVEELKPLTFSIPSIWDFSMQP